MLRFSDDNGANWSAAIRVNDDATTRSQFLPRIATNPATGNIGVCWHDARNSATNTAVQVFCTVSTPTPATPTFIASAAVSDGTSTSTGAGVEFGDYAGLTYFEGGGAPGQPRFLHPIWADTSNSTGNNANAPADFEAYTNWVRGGASTNEGDPHLRTVDGTHYDFQTAGEFTALRSADGFEVQTRQAAVATDFFPGPNPHTGLATCVSLNTAVAARVGGRRVTYQPDTADPGRPPTMTLRIDGNPTALTDAGVTIGGRARVSRTAVDGMEIAYRNGTLVTVTPGFWSSQNLWYLNVSISGSDALEGIMGAIARGSWLPALSDGTSLGPRPASLAQRYADLNVKFADSWRVTDNSSLFDYAPGQSTDDFTLRGWPKDTSPCDVPEMKPVKPLDPRIAQELCRPLLDKRRRENCEFDVVATGDRGFAETYIRTERMERFGTTITVVPEWKDVATHAGMGFVATVRRRMPAARVMVRQALAGTVVFFVDGRQVGAPVPIDRSGRARLVAPDVDPGKYRVRAEFRPVRGSGLLPSASNELVHPERNDPRRPDR
jgi:hypothetical protein